MSSALRNLSADFAQLLGPELSEGGDLNGNLPRDLDPDAPLQIQRRAPVDPWCLNSDVMDAIYQAVNGTPGPMPVGEVERR